MDGVLLLMFAVCATIWKRPAVEAGACVTTLSSIRIHVQVHRVERASEPHEVIPGEG